MAGAPELTRDLLMDAGGWKEMKEARAMHRSGMVREASYEDGLLSGVVMTGGKPRKVRMRIRSRTDMENKCSCFQARRDGRVCAHAVAVGLEVVDPRKKPDEGSAGETVVPEPLEDRWPTLADSPDGDAVPCRCSVMLPLKIAPSWERGRGTPCSWGMPMRPCSAA
jgi:hypothetical protein